MGFVLLIFGWKLFKAFPEPSHVPQCLVPELKSCIKSQFIHLFLWYFVREHDFHRKMNSNCHLSFIHWRCYLMSGWRDCLQYCKDIQDLTVRQWAFLESFKVKRNHLSRSAIASEWINNWLCFQIWKTISTVMRQMARLGILVVCL